MSCCLWNVIHQPYTLISPYGKTSKQITKHTASINGHLSIISHNLKIDNLSKRPLIIIISVLEPVKALLTKVH